MALSTDRRRSQLGLTRSRAEVVLDGALTVWIDPGRVDYSAGTQWPATRRWEKRLRQLPLVRVAARPLVKQLRARHPFSIPDHLYGPVVPVDSLERHVLIADLVDRLPDFRSSMWYQDLLAELREGGTARYRRHRFVRVEEIDAFFRDDVLGLLRSLSEDGYLLDRGGDLGSALIGPDGSLHKVGSGNHRFHAARILKIQSLPLKVRGAHAAWFGRTMRGHRLDDAGLRHLGAAVQQVAQAHTPA